MSLRLALVTLRLVAFLGADLDRVYVQRWLVELVGTNDERVGRWRHLIRDVTA